MEIRGTVLRGPNFDPVEGRVRVDEGEIVAIEEASVESSKVICPAFVNAHTHLGDSIAKEATTDGTLADLVAPPDGLKHRLLREASHEELVEAMTYSLRFAQASGTVACVDFREGGMDGVRQLRAAATGLDIEPVIMARESIEAMQSADGFGASGANDASFDEERTATREAGKTFGIHAGEADPSDLHPALDLDPDFLVHVVHPEPIHLDRIEDGEVPVVVCPRSNLVTGVGVAPIEELNDRTTLALGTDNVMFNSPSMFREMAYAAKLSQLSAREVLRMATVNAAEIAGLDCGVIEEGRPAKLVVLDGDSDNLAGVRDPVRGVVRRAGPADVERVIL